MPQVRFGLLCFANAKDPIDLRAKRKLSIELSNEGKLKITKIEAAVFQLETAISLWFSGSDSVSIVTLVFAAHEIIYQLNKDRPGSRKSLSDPPDPDLFNDHVNYELIKEDWRTIFKMDSNFCKHSGKDPDEIHYVATKNLPFVIADAIHMYAALGFHRRLYFQIFNMWIGTVNPEIFHIKPEQAGFKKSYIESVIGLGKERFFEIGRRQFAGQFATAGTSILRM